MLGSRTFALLALTGCTTGLTAIGNDLPDTDFDPDVPTDTDVDTDTVAPVDDNAAPVADAGFGQTDVTGTVIVLDGSASFDPDGDELTFSWIFTSSPPESGATILNDFREDPQFYADAAGVYDVMLTVDDGDLSSSDSISITITDPNGAPTANAGLDQTVAATSSVQLNGGNSVDPDGDTLNYTWAFVSKPAGSGASLSRITSSTPRFTADLAGTYAISLVVGDGVLTSSPDQVRITATSSSGDGDCGGCSAAFEAELRSRTVTGRAASAVGLFTLPFLVLLWQRRRR